MLPVNLQTFSEAFVDVLDSKELSKSFRYYVISYIRNRLCSVNNLKELSSVRKSETVEEETLNDDNITEDTDDLVFAAKRLGFQVHLNEITSSVLTIHNTGTSAYHFEWVRLNVANPLKTSASKDGIGRFYFSHKKGIILPGSAFDFIIIFKSANPGIFSETWKLLTSPIDTEIARTVEFQGVAIELDHAKEARKRTEAMLEKRIATVFAQEIINDLLLSLPSQKPLLFAAMDGDDLDGFPGQKPRWYTSEEERSFVLKNRELRVCFTRLTNQLFYSSAVYDKFVELSKDIDNLISKQNINWKPSSWSGAAHDIYEVSPSINPRTQT
jgi:hypothetical protein